MHKLLPISLGAVGVGGLGVGGFVLFRPQTKVVNPYREKYESAILKEEDTSLWNKKFELLSSATPVHETLKLASGTLGDESARRVNHKKGCQEIYDSSSRDAKYFDDFKKYCSKNNGDAIGSGWINEATDGTISPPASSKWGAKLTALMGNKDKVNIQVLKTLAGTLSGSTFDKDKKDRLKEWCEGQKSEIFLGEGDALTKGIRNYCIDNG